jgi:phospholipid/cholesterol/gamma-HCH transport system substrate-binding protein
LSIARSATPVVGNLRLATEELVPAVRVLRPAAQRGEATMRELSSFARAATPAMVQLQPFAAKATAFVPPLEGFLREANPLFAYVAPYFREVSTFFALTAASFQPTDATGHVARITLPLSRSNAPGLLTAEQEKQLQALSASFDTRGTNAYPAPGGAGAGQAFSGAYPRLAADAPYTR